MRHIIYILLAVILLSSCSGEDNPNKDTTAPTQPVLIPHMGDTGDSPIQLDEDSWLYLNEENNGLDTVPDGHMMVVRWEPFIDTDLSHIKVYRFSDYESEPVEIDQVQANQQSYLDQGPLIERVWYSYFIELFDTSGNSTVSDTVSYALLAKTNLVAPDDGAFISTEDFHFYWNRADDRTGFYRVLLWDENNDLLWNGDFHLATEDDPLHLPLPNLNPPLQIGSTLRWRVDYFDWDEEHQMFMGSESEERIFTITGTS
jgi:hypothetical protein